MNKVRVFVAGKINLSLNILGAGGGLHLLDSVMASVDLGDFVTVSLRADNTVNLRFVDGAGGVVGGSVGCGAGYEAKGYFKNVSGDGLSSPSDLGGIDPENNTVKKTVDFVRSKIGDFGADIVVEKHIPVAAGLGGSSADIAAVLFALCHLLGLKKRGFDIMEAAKQLGSDVPFMLTGGCARVGGTGDIITPVTNNLPLFAVVASGKTGVSSGQAYRRFDTRSPSLTSVLTDNDKLVSMLGRGDINAINLFANALEEAAESLCGGISSTMQVLKKAGARRAVMTGSGSAVVGFFDDFSLARAAAVIVAKQGYFAKPCQTVDRGVIIIE